MTQPEKVTQLDVQRVEQSVEQERTERRHEMRRHDDRMNALEAEQLRTQRVLFGEHGTNGIAGDVKMLKSADRRWERVVWLLLVTAVGSIAYLVR